MLARRREGRGRTKCWPVEGNDSAAAGARQRPHDVAPRERAAAVAMYQDNAGVGARGLHS